jgi:RHS repeat-associated protein
LNKGCSARNAASRFAYDGLAVWADLNGSNQVQVQYLQGPGIDEVLARSVGGASAWSLTDRMGSVRQITNLAGSVLDTITYDPFGGVASESGPSYGDRYKYTGREYDSTSQLQYSRARYYDGSTGRWLSEDPLGFSAGDVNLYRYVWNAPTGYVDPMGTDGGGVGQGGGGGFDPPPGGAGRNWGYAALWNVASWTSGFGDGAGMGDRDGLWLGPDGRGCVRGADGGPLDDGGTILSHLGGGKGGGGRGGRDRFWLGDDGKGCVRDSSGGGGRRREAPDGCFGGGVGGGGGGDDLWLGDDGRGCDRTPGGGGPIDDGGRVLDYFGGGRSGPAGLWLGPDGRGCNRTPGGGGPIDDGGGVLDYLGGGFGGQGGGGSDRFWLGDDGKGCNRTPGGGGPIDDGGGVLDYFGGGRSGSGGRDGLWLGPDGRGCNRTPGGGGPIDDGGRVLNYFGGGSGGTAGGLGDNWLSHIGHGGTAPVISGPAPLDRGPPTVRRLPQPLGPDGMPIGAGPIIYLSDDDAKWLDSIPHGGMTAIITGPAPLDSGPPTIRTMPQPLGPDGIPLGGGPIYDLADSGVGVLGAPKDPPPLATRGFEVTDSPRYAQAPAEELAKVDAGAKDSNAAMARRQPSLLEMAIEEATSADQKVKDFTGRVAGEFAGRMADAVEGGAEMIGDAVILDGRIPWLYNLFKYGPEHADDVTSRMQEDVIKKYEDELRQLAEDLKNGLKAIMEGRALDILIEQFRRDPAGFLGRALADLAQLGVATKGLLRAFCFVAGTLVSTETGLRPIEEVRSGEQVWAYDFATGAWKLCEVGWAESSQCSLYGLGKDVPGHLELVRITNEERGLADPQLPFELIPIMNDGAGNHYCLDTSKMQDSECPVVFFDHEDPEGSMQIAAIEAQNFSIWLTQRILEMASHRIPK